MMPLLHLDIGTLLASECLICVMFSLVLAMLAHRFPEIRGAPRLTQSFLASAAGALLFLLSGPMPLFAAVLLANAALMLANLLFYIGVDALLQVKPRIMFPAAVAIVALMLLAWFTGVSNELGARIVLLSMADCLMQVWLLIDLLRTPRKSIPVYLLSASVMLSMCADVLRALALSIGGPAAHLFEDSAVQSIFMVTGVLAACGFGIFGLMLVMDEITEGVERSARCDSLTGVLNRRGIEELLQGELDRAARGNQRLALALLDLDAFKAVNDTWGHPAGDALLCEVAECVTSTLRRYDACGRIGGDEFLLLFPGSSAIDAKGICERILQRVVGRPSSAVQGFSASVSIGFTELHSSDTSQTIIARADRALYLAKEDGRGCVRELLFSTRSARRRALGRPPLPPLEAPPPIARIPD